MLPGGFDVRRRGAGIVGTTCPAMGAGDELVAEFGQAVREAEGEVGGVGPTAAVEVKGEVDEFGAEGADTGEEFIGGVGHEDSFAEITIQPAQRGQWAGISLRLVGRG